MDPSQARAGHGQFFGRLLMFTLSTLSNPVEIVARHIHGIRSITPASIFFMIGAMFGCGVLGLTLTANAGRDPFSPTALIEMLVLALIVLLGIAHHVLAHVREKRGEMWHSYSPGLSHLTRTPLFDDIPMAVTQRFFEPLIAVGLGVGLFYLNLPILGTVMAAGGVAVFFKEQTRFAYQRNRYLDMIDAQIEGETFEQRNEKGFFNKPEPDAEQHKGFTPYIPPEPKDPESAKRYAEGVLQKYDSGSAASRWGNYSHDANSRSKGGDSARN